MYDYFALLKTFNTNTLNLHQYFKDKLSSHQPSRMHDTRHRTKKNFNTPLFNPRCVKLEAETDSAIRQRKRTGVTSPGGREGS